MGGFWLLNVIHHYAKSATGNRNHSKKKNVVRDLRTDHPHPTGWQTEIGKSVC